MGVESLESNEDITSTKSRQRRPELPGNNQRPARYRHRYPRETIANNDYVSSSQKAIRSASLDHVGKNTDKGGECLASLENEETDLSTVEENKLNDILAGLLSCNPEDLEGDGATTLLQEGLQIKPIVLEELSVLEFPDNQVIDRNSFRGKLPKPRKALSNTDNLLKGTNNTTPLRQDVGYPVQQLASPTPLRSPFASLLSLQQHISRSNPSADPFSTHEVDHSSARNCSPTHMINQEPDLVGSGKLSDKLDARIIEDVIAVSKTGSVVDTDRNWTGAYGKSKVNNYRKSLDKLNVTIIENTIELGGTTFVKDTVKNCAGTSQKSVEDNSGERGFDANIDTNESHVDMDVDVGGSDKDNGLVDDIKRRPDFDGNGPCESDGIIQAENMHAPAASVLMDDLNFNLVNPIDQSNPAGCQATVTYKYTKISNDGPEQCLQVPEEKDGSSVPVNEQRRAKLRSQKQSKHKRLSQRQSRAAADTSCNAGLRKSTRIRTRPLEYWKGERMVYGRVHDNALVLGLKRNFADIGATIEENKLDDILAGLLRCNPEDLEGDGKLSGKLDERIIDDVIAVSKTGSVVDTDRNWTGAYGKSKENNYRKSLDKLNVPIIENTIELGGTTFVEETVKNCAGTSQKYVEDNSGEPGFDANIDTNESHVDMDVDIGGSDKDNRVVDDIKRRPNFDGNGPCESDGIIQTENMHAPAASVLMDDLNFNLVNPIEQSNPAGCQAIVTYKYSKISDDGPEQCLQVPEEKDGSSVPVNEQRRAKLRSQKQSKHKRLSRRQSHAAAGTSCNAGLRKSRRIRTRPLEYWKGERMVYGRVHDSLATVIGVKCLSPGSDGKPTMKVKSYVSDEYKELLGLASLH
ncbi:unnamed protein product [Lupinus luteus]|uniref:Centromere protein C n=1 Tax=Lupinus luteus TaxID=3873 RepID=A0AAV1WNY2_LUPLU